MYFSLAVNKALETAVAGAGPGIRQKLRRKAVGSTPPSRRHCNLCACVLTRLEMLGRVTCTEVRGNNMQDWTYDDLCALATRQSARLLNAGSGPIVPKDIQCRRAQIVLFRAAEHTSMHSDT